VKFIDHKSKENKNRAIVRSVRSEIAFLKKQMWSNGGCSIVVGPESCSVLLMGTSQSGCEACSLQEAVRLDFCKGIILLSKYS